MCIDNHFSQILFLFQFKFDSDYVSKYLFKKTFRKGSLYGSGIVFPVHVSTKKDGNSLYWIILFRLKSFFFNPTDWAFKNFILKLLKNVGFL